MQPDYLLGQARYGAARRLHERALAIREVCLSSDHPDTASSRRNLAAVVAELHDRQ